MAFKYTNKLQGRRVLVMGGSSGIGFAVAEAAVEHGALVTISSSNQTKLDKAVSRLQAHAQAVGLSPDAITAKTCDLSQPDALDATVTALLAYSTQNGTNKLDHVVFTAGDGLATGELANVQVAQLQRMNNVRHLGAIILAKHLPAYVHASPRSSLTLTTGTQSRRPVPSFSVIAGNSAGVEGLARGFAVALAPVRVNSVMPGAVKTELFGAVPEDQLPGMLEIFKRDSLLGTVGTPEELAEAYVYLMKDSFATGTTVVSDGGRLVGDRKEVFRF